MILLLVIGALLMIVAAIAYGTLVWGFLLFKFWGWFLLPIFPQVGAISFTQAIMLTLFLSAIRGWDGVGKSKIDAETDPKDKKKTLWTNLLTPWMFLGLAWIWHTLLS